VTLPAAPSLPPFSLADPAWLTALATIGLLVFAVLTALAAFMALAKQSREVGLLALQAERDIEDRARAQAANVFVIVPGPDQQEGSHGLLIVRNNSPAPVYDLALSAPFWPADRGGPECPVLPPGGGWPMATDAATPDTLVTLMFTDAAGRRWRTTSRGGLAEAGAAAGRITAQ
jgi:hypothetical protein